MNPARKRMLYSVISSLLLCSMLLSGVAPLITAQDEPAEVTQEALVSETTEQPTATDMPTTEPTPEATLEITVETTAEPTSEATSEATSQPEVTAEPTDVPPTPLSDSLFQDDFQDGDSAGWNTSLGWQIATNENNLFLYAATPSETATIADLNWAHLLLSARLRIDPANSASITLRSGYEIALDADGRASLYHSDTLLAQGPEPETITTEATWRTLNIQALGSVMIVGVDSVVQFSYDDPASLTDGFITFSTADDNTGAVAFDDVVIHKLDAPVIVTETPVEVTPELTPEATPEVTSEATEEPTLEVTEEPVTQTPILSADFESELTDWVLSDGASVVVESETNHALLLATGASLAPAETLYLADLQIDARVNILSGISGGLNFSFRAQEGRSYTLSLEEGQTALYRNDGEESTLLTSAAAEHALNTWHTLNLNAQAGVISVSINGTTELTYADETPLLNGQIAFSASGDSILMLDDIAVFDLSPSLAVPTSTPSLLTEASAGKLDGALYNVLSLYLNGDQTAALELAAASQIEVLDEAQRIHVIVWASGEDTQAIAPLIETTGGIIDLTDGRSAHARVPLESLLALINTDAVSAILLPQVATSTNSSYTPSESVSRAAAGSVVPHSLDIIGWNNWNSGNEGAVAPILGAGVNVGVIDIGFAGANPSNGNQSCLNSATSWSPTPTIPNTSNHGLNLVEVICDIAPSSTVRMYRANSASNLDDAINKARTDGNRIIVMALDLGVNVSPGDGTGGGSINAVYTAITTARNAGILVIASAGNNNGRSVTINYTGSAVTVPVTTYGGERINVSWSDWAAPSDLTMTLSGDVTSGNTPIGGSPGKSYLIPSTGACNPGPCSVNLNIAASGASYTVQVQATGNSTINPASVTGANLNAGNLGRPADSPDVLAVGAVCSSQSANYPALPSSSRGPIFTAGGVGPLASDGTRNTIKPDLSAPSFVDTSLLTTSGDCASGPGVGVEPDSGFSGTSAAAAHVAGMAALLISNTNTSMDAFNSGAGAADALQNYLQTHSIDLYAATPGVADGYDNTFGSGLTMLGNPTYNLNNVRNHAVAAAGGTLYVGLAAPGSPQLGTPTEPFISIAQAVAEATAGQRVIVMPGEYVSSMVISNKTNVQIIAYNSPNAFGTGLSENNSIFWVNDSYQGDLGIIYLEGSDTVTIDGFIFNQASPTGVSSASGYNFDMEPPAITLFNTSNSSILNNTFTGIITGSGVNEANNGFGVPPVQVGRSDGSGNTIANSGGSGNTIRGNQFLSNKAQTASRQPSALEIYGASTNPSDTPIRVERNTFAYNGGDSDPFSLIRESIIDVVESGAQIFSNRFFENRRQSIIRVQAGSDNPAAISYETQVFSNAFWDNFTEGPLVHLNPGPRFRFINNTVIGNNLNVAGPAYAWIILRGNEQSFLGSGNWENFRGLWELHNNIIFNNFIPGGFVQAGNSSDITLLCNSITTGTTGTFGDPSDDGARNNWIWSFSTDSTNALIPSGGFADCTNAIHGANPLGVNGNILNRNPNTDPAVGGTSTFIGATVSPNNPYRLKQGSTAIEVGFNAGLTAAMAAGVDAMGFDRIQDGNGDDTPIPIVDLGAYELTPLTTRPLNIDRTEDTFEGGDQATAFRINLLDGVQGGFEPYTFQIKSQPENFSTNTSDYCGGAGLIFQGNSAYYCPPEHFYTIRGTSSAPGLNVVDDVEFEFYVSDSTGAQSTKFDTITIRIFEQNDLALTAGDAVNYRYLAEINQSFGLRLRPSVRFNNFRFSERGTARNNQADYPFTYGTINVLTIAGDNPNLFSSNPNPASARTESQAYIAAQVGTANPDDGLFTLTPQPGQIGFLSFSYIVTDIRGGSVTNTVRLEVVGNIPDGGLHDDTSFSFVYTDVNEGAGKWTALYNEASINNTLHQTRAIGDVARFLMIGEEFTLYMQPHSSGGLWELKIDDTPESPKPNPIDWQLQPNGEWRGTLPGEGWVCTTRAPIGKLTSTATARYISNKGNALYSVSCSGLRDGEAHEIKIINRQNKILNVDAMSLQFSSNPLSPGYHDVNQPDFIAAFPQWEFVRHASASQGIALAATSATTPDGNFSFKGTGIAIGTALERFGRSPNFQGAVYNICITPGGVNTQEFCQTFNNLGTSAKPVWNVFRPFFGFDPTLEHRVRIDVLSLPVGGRLIVDSIRVFDQAPTAPLRFGDNENDMIGNMVFANGRDDSWVFNTRNNAASNASLHTLVASHNKIGPFVSFQIPDAANLIYWYRVPNTRTDSQQIQICVDRAQGELGIAAENLCRTVNLRNEPNPVVISESQFTGGWGTAWGANNTHTIEIFSLLNNNFNMDRVQVLGTDLPLMPGLYEELVLNIHALDNTPKFGYFNPSNALNGGSFTRVNHAQASGKSYFQTSTTNDGVFFQMNGTGLSALFRMDNAGGNVQFCWQSGLLATVADVGTTNCRTYNNDLTGTAVFYQAARTLHLSDTPANFTVTIRNLGGSMKFDALQIHGALPGNILEIDADGVQRYETSFANRVADDLFTYIGAGWRTVVGNAAKAYSGLNYDTISKRFGAGIIFRTDGADRVQINRPAKSNYAILEVCIDDDPCLPPIAAMADPVVVNLPDTNEHTISVSLLSTGTFILDSITLFDTSVPIAPGQYEDNYPLLNYDTNWTNTPIASKYTDKRGKQTSTVNATLLFTIGGSYLQIGAFAPQADQMQVCYATGMVTNPDDVSFGNCETAPVAGSNARQVYQRDLGAAGVYTIRVRNLIAANLVIDYISNVNAFDPLIPGLYEETHPKVATGLIGTWLPAPSNSAYSSKAAVQTTTLDDRLVFDFEGTGFQIGTTTDKNGGSVLVCYEQGSLSSFANHTDIDEFCFTYNHLTNANNFMTSRTVAGLDPDTYSVRVVNATDTKLLRIDYVRVLEGQPPLAPAGIYNENAVDSSGVPYLYLSPATNWLSVVGNPAARFSGRSYVGVANNNRLVTTVVGPAAALRVNIPNGSQTIILLDTGVPANNNSDQLLVCVDHVDNAANATPDCQTVTTMRTTQQQVVVLTAAQYGAGEHIVTFRTLTTGGFKIDGFQIMEGSTLSEGIYDSTLMSDGGLIDTDLAWSAAIKNTRAYGGSQIRTQVNNAALNFDFEGTGFSIITQQSTTGINVTLCYALEADFDGTWNGTGPGNETCVNSTTDLAKGAVVYQSGLSIYGLVNGVYKAQMRVNDTVIDTRRDWLYVDAVVIFGDTTSALQPGMYDDAELLNHPDAVRFGPSGYWSRLTTNVGPAAGPWQRTQTLTTNAGTVAQFNVEGNALVLYQGIDGAGSSNIRVCLVINIGATNELECNNFSQNGKRTFFTPIVFYGLGTGEHRVIFENRVPNRRFNVDAVMVMP